MTKRLTECASSGILEVGGVAAFRSMKMQRRPIQFLPAVLAVIAFLIFPAAIHAQRQPAPVSGATLDGWNAYVDERANTILQALDEGGSVEDAREAGRDLLAQLTFYAPDEAVDAFLRAAELARLLNLIRYGLASESSDGLRQTMRAHPEFTRTILFFLESLVTDLQGAVKLLERMHEERGEQIVRYPELTAAIVAVHSIPLRRRFNENSAEAPDPIALFDYFVKHEQRMFFGLRIPPEWLVHVVDTTTSIEEMEWAVRRYAGDAVVGARFFDVDYDYDHLQRGTPKKSTAAGWNLLNILQYGGVCADQAYFAMSVGKAIGVPTAYCVGKADSNHAWVGFVQRQGRNVGWNFTIGRYESYQRVRGEILDPRTRGRLADSEVALRVEAARTDAIDRWRSAALNDMAKLLWAFTTSLSPSTVPTADPAIAEIARAEPRRADGATQLWFIEQSLRRYPANEFAWGSLRTSATHGDMTLADKKRWTDIVDSLCGTAYPDFSFSVLAPLVSTVDDVDEQHRIWNALFRNFQRRDDIAAEIRMRQGKLWEDAGNLLKAGQCYEDVIQRYPNTGYLIVHALAAAEQVLIKGNRPDLILPLYGQAWNRMQAPENKSVYFTRGTPWWIVGNRLGALFEQNGMAQQAAEVQRRVNGQ